MDRPILATNVQHAGALSSVTSWVRRSDCTYSCHTNSKLLHNARAQFINMVMNILINAYALVFLIIHFMIDE